MPAAYPEEFRRRAVDLVRESDESLSAVARRLGISVSGLRRRGRRTTSVRTHRRRAPNVRCPNNGA